MSSKGVAKENCDTISVGVVMLSATHPGHGMRGGGSKGRKTEMDHDELAIPDCHVVVSGLHEFPERQ